MNLHRHFILHKPYGTISQFVNPHKRKKKLLGELYDFPEGTMTPAKAVTMGIATILAARRIVLLATGGEKAETLRRAQQGPITADCPASYLQLHGNVTVICDSAVAARLKDPT